MLSYSEGLYLIGMKGSLRVREIFFIQITNKRPNVLNMAVEILGFDCESELPNGLKFANLTFERDVQRLSLQCTYIITTQ